MTFVDQLRPGDLTPVAALYREFALWTPEIRQRQGGFGPIRDRAIAERV